MLPTVPVTLPEHGVNVNADLIVKSDPRDGPRSPKDVKPRVRVKDDAADLDAVFHEGQHSAAGLACQALSFAEPVGLAPHPPKKLGCGLL